MTSITRRLLLFILVLFAVACMPAQSPHRRGGSSREDPNAAARWLLRAGKDGCLTTSDDLHAGDEPKLEIAGLGQGVPAPNNPNSMGVRESILKELLAYAKATDKSEKENHAEKLRELFRSIASPAALPFQAMLETKDALAVTFRQVLKDDALKDELYGILEKKHTPPAAQPPQQAPAPPAQPSTPSLVLPAVALTDEASFGELHKAVKEQIDLVEAGAKRLSRSATTLCKKRFEKITVPSMRNLLADTEKTKTQAFNETDAFKRAKGLKKAGDEYLGAFYLTQIILLELNFILVADWADGEEQGVPSVDPLSKIDPMLAQPVRDYEDDEAILNLLLAAGQGDAVKIADALPKGTARFQHHLQFLDKWIVSVQKGAILSKKVIAVANAAMIAISIYQVWKMPVMVGGGTPPLPAVVGAFPGGVAIGSRVSVAGVASLLEAIRKLVAIGALDGALVGGLSALGGSPGAAVPELQKPSLSVQAPNQAGGAATKLTAPSGQPSPAAKPTGPRATFRPNDSAETVRGRIRENESADVLAKAGYKVEQRPAPPTGSPKNPDFKIEGEYFDNYAPDKETSVRNAWTRIKSKVDEGQASRIVLNLDDWGGDFAALQKQFKDWPIGGLLEVFIIQSGKVTQFFP